MACGADAQGTKLYLECRLKEWSPYRMAHKWERWWRIWRKAEKEGERFRSWGDGSLVKTLAIQTLGLRLGSLRAHINSRWMCQSPGPQQSEGRDMGSQAGETWSVGEP